MSTVTLADARRIIEAAEKRADEIGQPMNIAVVDAGGNLVVLKREDGSGVLRADIAIGKAWGALGMGVGSRSLAERAVRVPAFFSALNAVSEGRFVPVPGGVLIRDVGGRLLGAVGVSGDGPDHDEACAVHAVESCGLVAQPG